MDFPTCPACGQSVIDDDVDDCPFCGSSMKAKPGSKPAAKSPATKPAATGSKTPAPAGKPGAAPAASGAKPAAKPGAKPGPADDFPFEAEVPGAKTAVQAMPNASKGRTLQVVCPMCETAGFVPPTAAGKDVKCANPKCMVPVFRAPVAAVDTPAPPPPKKGNPLLVGGITVAVMAVIGVGAVFLPGMLGGSKPANSGGPSDEARELIAEAARKNAAAKKTDAAPNDAVKPQENLLPDDKKTETIPKTTDEFIAASLRQLNEVSLRGDSRQRSKAYCRQLAAEAAIAAGETKVGADHLTQLVFVGPSVPYYRIEPTLEMFWIAWAAGDKPAAKSHLDAALADAQKLPQIGRNQLEVASKLAAALAVSGNLKGALAQLDGHQTSEPEGQLAAWSQMASDGHLSRLTMSKSVLPWTRPQAVAATASLVARGQMNPARAWAEAQADEEGRAECLAVWAEGVAQRQTKPGAASGSPEIADAVKALPPSLAARVWARAAFGRLSAGDTEGAAATLKTARDSLGTISAPPEPEMPGIKAAIGYKLPAAAPLVQAASSAAEIAFVYSFLPNQTAQAEEALELALTFVRGLAPAWPAVSAKVTQAEQAGAGGMRDIMKKELNLKNDDQASQNVLKYRKVLTDLGDASQRRFSLQVRILSRLIDAGLKEKVWSVVGNRSGDSNANRRDEFLSSPLVGELLEVFRGTDTEKVILGALASGTEPARPELAIARQLVQQNPAQAAQYVSQLDAKSGRRDQLALLFASYLASIGKVDETLSFIGNLGDIVLREEAYQQAAALLAQRGQAETVWKHAVASQQATEKASLFRGLITGLKAGPAVKELPEPSLGPG